MGKQRSTKEEEECDSCIRTCQCGSRRMGYKGTCVSLVLAASVVVFAKGTPLHTRTTSISAQADADPRGAEVSPSLGLYRFLSSGLFEGDLKLTKEEIGRHYRIHVHEDDGENDADVGNGTRAGARNIRAAVSSSGSLWPNAVIRYVVAPDAPHELVDTIYNAMAKWEDETCLRFLPRRSFDHDYVNFTTENVCNDVGACCSDSVGRKGGEQKVSLHAAYCNHEGTILHLIGHVIGFWHEESRPDRDNYISINYNNIQTGAHDQFLKRDDLDVDYQGVGYDYGSIMHLPLTAFTCCPFPFPRPTMEITNYAEYAKQRSPVGQLNHTSASDGEQARRLYNCPADGIAGRLTVYVENGYNFSIVDGSVYIRITAVDNHGDQTIKTTDSTHVQSTEDPKWNQELEFGDGEWQFFHMRVYEQSPGNDDAISMSETVVIEGNADQYRDHCLTTQSSVRYMYKFTVDGRQCMPNPCKNGGKCYESADSYDGSSSYMCICTPGWTGTHCDIRVACSSNPCKNGGTCCDHTSQDAGTSTYTCSCPPDWTGTNCETRPACFPNPCQHAGTCYETTGSNVGSSAYTCTCEPGWSGKDCHICLACSSKPCQNGGTCNEHTNFNAGTSTYTCSCPAGWIGTNCQGRSACYRNPCQNGGTCHYETTDPQAGLSTYTCACGPGCTGTNCHIRLACSSSPCQNGGTCWEDTNHEAGTSTYVCTCPPDWTGSNCDDCPACYGRDPCQNNGTCYSLSDQLSGTSTSLCHCPPGWTGTICHIRLPCETHPCHNGGTCINSITNYDRGISMYSCSCPGDWTGTNCHIRIQCYSNPCQNGGICADLVDRSTGISSYTCHCQSGWTGTNCHIKVQCYSNPCQNGGICADLIDHNTGISSYTCHCQSGWTGTNCHIWPSCNRNPCQNGGRCTNHIDYNTGTSTYTCSCPSGWTGTNCHIAVLCCSNPCQNGGTCTDQIDYFAGNSTYNCSCPSGWTGTNCSIRSSCHSNPCQHGTCTDQIDYNTGTSTYSCACSILWTGTNCEEQIVIPPIIWPFSK